MHTIGIDIGTTKICAVRYDNESGEVRKTSSAPNSFDIAAKEPFGKIQDPEGIYATVLSLLHNVGTNGVGGIGISNQMHGILYVDERGLAASPLYTWQDGRGNEKHPDGGTYSSVFGAPSGYGLTTHFYNRSNGLVPNDAAVLCSIGDYIAMRLCDNSKPLTHITNAASFGKFDAVSNSFIINDPLLPDVAPVYSVCGQYRGIPVTVAIGDNQASFAGAVTSEDDVLINIGTGSQASFLSEKPIVSASAETRPYDGKKYLIACCALCGGRAFADAVGFINECVRLIADDWHGDIYPYVDKLLDSYNGEGLTVDTRFCGTRTDPDIRGSINGISEENFTPAALLTGVCDGIARELFDMLLSCDPYFFKNDRKLIGSGGGIRKNPAMRRAIEKVFGKKLHFTSFNEEAAVGAALIANYNIIG